MFAHAGLLIVNLYIRVCVRLCNDATAALEIESPINTLSHFQWMVCICMMRRLPTPAWVCRMACRVWLLRVCLLQVCTDALMPLPQHTHHCFLLFLNLFIYFIFYIKRVLAKGQQKTFKKKNIPLIARSCKEESRRDRSKGWTSS